MGEGDRGRRARGDARATTRSGSYDHFHNVPFPAHETMFECWTTLAAISQRTSRLRLGQMVGCAPYRNPGTARQDHVEHRRDVGWSARLGHRRGLVRARVQRLRLRVPESAKDRIGVLRETVEIVKAMWSEPDTTYEGKYFRLHGRAVRPEAGAATTPADLDRRRRRAAHACGSSRATRTASNFGGKPHELAHKCEVLKGHCEDVGRDYDEIAKTWSPEVFIRETEQEIIDGGTRQLLGRAVRVVARRQPRRHAGTGRREGPGVRRSRLHRLLPVVQRLPRHRDDAPLRGEGRSRTSAEPEVGVSDGRRNIDRGEPAGRCSDRRHAARRDEVRAR